MGTPDTKLQQDPALVVLQNLLENLRKGSSYGVTVTPQEFTRLFSVPLVLIQMMQTQGMSLFFIPSEKEIKIVLPGRDRGVNVAAILNTDERKKPQVVEQWYTHIAELMNDPNAPKGELERVLEISAWGLGLVWFDEHTNARGLFDKERRIDLHIDQALAVMQDQIDYRGTQMIIRDPQVYWRGLWHVIGAVDPRWQQEHSEISPRQINLAAVGSAAHS